MFLSLRHTARACLWRFTRRSETTWSSLGVNQTVIEALKELRLLAPTSVQQEVIPTILRGKDAIFAAQTGTGKTLAYLAPIAQRIKKDEENGIECRPSRPRALVIVPTRELAYQVLSVAKSLSHTVKFRSTCISGGAQSAIQKKALSDPIDLCVATPGRLLQHRERGSIFFTDVRVVVLDEADTLFSGDFEEALDKIITPIKDNPKHCAQFVCVSATLPQKQLKLMQRLFPKAQTFLMKSAHVNPKNVEQHFIRVTTRDKYGPMIEVLRNNQDLRTLIFCNTLASCRAAEHHLREKGFDTVCFHGDIPPQTRAENWKAFVASPSAVAVCTDAAARGLDTTMIQHVILADFPNNSIDYLHRIGRTGRMGKRGKATSLIAKKDIVLAEAIQTATRAGLPIEPLTASKEQNERILAQLKAQKNPEKPAGKESSRQRVRLRNRTISSEKRIRATAATSTVQRPKRIRRANVSPARRALAFGTLGRGNQ